MNIHGWEVCGKERRTIVLRTKPILGDWMEYVANHTALAGYWWDDVVVRNEKTGRVLYVASRTSCEVWLRNQAFKGKK